MNYTQNQKISQITPSTLVIGIDVAKDKHVARTQDDRGLEFGKRLIFENRIHGFELLLEWALRHAKENSKDQYHLWCRTNRTLLAKPCLLSECKGL